MLACSVLAFGLYAVGPAQLYPGDSLPDYAVIGLAAALTLTSFARWAALGAGGPWDWGAVRAWSWLPSGVSAVVLVLTSLIVPVETGITRVGDSAHGFTLFCFVGRIAVLVASRRRARRRGEQRCQEGSFDDEDERGEGERR